MLPHRLAAAMAATPLFSSWQQGLRWAGAGLLAALAGVAPGPACCQPLTLVTVPFPPLITQGPRPDSVGGPLAERMVEVVSQAGFAVHVGLYPLARALEVARLNDDTCMMVMTRTPEREPLYQWVGPVFNRKLVLYAAPGSTLEIKTLADARRYRVGAELGNAVVGYLKAEGIEPELAPTPENNARKLLARRLDLWADMDLIAQITLQTYKLPELRTAHVFGSWEGHMACSLKTNPQLVSRLQAAVAEARGRGLFKEFEN
jgi:polar amino acid transport system substrate-binding protein